MQAEMGGHNAVSCWPTPTWTCATGSVMAAYGTTGQRCTAPRRIIAVRSVADELVALLADETRKITVGPGDEAGVDVGPLIDAKALAEVSRSSGAPSRRGQLSRRGARRSAARAATSSSRRCSST